jgi:hypothetical protein
MARRDLHRMRRDAAALGALLLLGGCGGFEGPQASDNVHTLCYTRLSTGADEVRTLAKQACNGAAPQFRGQHMDLSACPILTPERIYFACGA